MKYCDTQAGGKKGDDRKAFMKSCVAGVAPTPKTSIQQNKMAKCQKDASAQGLKGDERKAFMSSCLNG